MEYTQPWRRQRHQQPERARPWGLAAHTAAHARPAPPRGARRRSTEIGQVPRRGGDPAYVHEAFGERASGQPDAIAVVSAAGELTYRQLSESANQLAPHLPGPGGGPG